VGASAKDGGFCLINKHRIKYLGIKKLTPRYARSVCNDELTRIG